MIAIRGFKSEIARKLIPMLESPELEIVGRDDEMPLNCDRYLICSGLLHAKKRIEQSPEEIKASLRDNLWQPINDCDRILAGNVRARICVIGSESAFTGSFNEVYAMAKRELHRYVETKRLKSPHQQLVCIAPSIIKDAGMTVRRLDTRNLMERRALHPKQRFLEAEEVARLVHHVLYVDKGYLSGVVIRMNGGAHA